MFATTKPEGAGQDFFGASASDPTGAAIFAPASSAPAFVPGPIVPSAASSAFGHFGEDSPAQFAAAPGPSGPAKERGIVDIVRDHCKFRWPWEEGPTMECSAELPLPRPKQAPSHDDDDEVRRETDPIPLSKPKKPAKPARSAKKAAAAKPTPAPPAPTGPVGPVREPTPEPDPDDVACDESYPEGAAREMCKMGNKLKQPMPEGGKSVPG